MRAALGLVVVVSACDGVFGLTGLPTEHPDAAPRCDYEMLAPDGDADGDGVLNGVDTCPLSTSSDPADEDGDGVPDICDRCPQFASAGADADCDGLGAACDPDDTVPHQMSFHGLNTDADLYKYQATLDKGSVVMTLPAIDGFGAANVLTPITAVGMFETQLTVENSDTTFAELSLALTEPMGMTVLRFEIESNAARWELDIVEAGVDQPAKVIGPLGPKFTVRIRGWIDGTSVRAEITGDAAATVEGTIAPVTNSVVMGVWAFRETNTTSKMTVTIPYILRVTQQ